MCINESKTILNINFNSSLLREAKDGNKPNHLNEWKNQLLVHICSGTLFTKKNTVLYIYI